jgi:pSer/pThr/pTyr-binding forkhead associated (FHA) protein
MIQFVFLSGKTAGTAWVARRFPVRAGRAPDNDLRLEAPGVYDRHFEVDVTSGQTLELSVLEPALVNVNAQPVTRCNLRHGDLVEAGAVRLRFWLAPTRQARLWSSQAGVWIAWILVLVAQFVLLRWLNS